MNALLGVAAVSGADTASGVGIPLALTAGLVSFLSPCVLPLVPGYISTVVGVSPAEMSTTGKRRLLVPSLLFVLSFSAIFILLGLSATAIGSTLRSDQQTLMIAGGWVIVALGVAFVLSPFSRLLSFQWHSQSLMRLAGRGGPVVAGAAFAIAWTPCTSITLGAILTQATFASSTGHAAILLAFYSAGLAIPFLLLAVAFERVSGALAVVRRHFPIIIFVGGAVMIALGALIVTGDFQVLNAEANNWLHGTGLDVSSI